MNPPSKPFYVPPPTPENIDELVAWHGPTKVAKAAGVAVSTFCLRKSNGLKGWDLVSPKVHGNSRYLCGRTLEEWAQHLNKLGARTKTGKEFTKQSFNRLVQIQKDKARRSDREFVLYLEERFKL